MPVESRTFYLRPPTGIPLADGSPFRIQGMDSTFTGIAGNFARAGWNVYRYPVGKKPDPFKDVGSFFNFLAQVIFCSDRGQTYYTGGPDAAVHVATSIPRQVAEKASETIFALRKQGGGAINSGDVVSIEVDPMVHEPGIPNRYYFRVDNASNGGDIVADGVTP